MTLNRAILGILVLAASVFCVLAFGNPQWNKLFYLVQANYLGMGSPTSEGENTYLSRDVQMRTFNYLNPPRGYSGTWTSWDKRGVKVKEEKFSSGVKSGLTKYYGESNVVILNECWHSGSLISSMYEKRMDQTDKFGANLKLIINVDDQFMTITDYLDSDKNLKRRELYSRRSTAARRFWVWSYFEDGSLDYLIHFKGAKSYTLYDAETNVDIRSSFEIPNVEQYVQGYSGDEVSTDLSASVK